MPNFSRRDPRTDYGEAHRRPEDDFTGTEVRKEEERKPSYKELKRQMLVDERRQAEASTAYHQPRVRKNLSSRRGREETQEEEKRSDKALASASHADRKKHRKKLAPARDSKPTNIEDEKRIVVESGFEQVRGRSRGTRKAENSAEQKPSRSKRGPKRSTKESSKEAARDSSSTKSQEPRAPRRVREKIAKLSPEAHSEEATEKAPRRARTRSNSLERPAKSTQKKQSSRARRALEHSSYETESYSEDSYSSEESYAARPAKKLTVPATSKLAKHHPELRNQEIEIDRSPKAPRKARRRSVPADSEDLGLESLSVHARHHSRAQRVDPPSRAPRRPRADSLTASNRREIPVPEDPEKLDSYSRKARKERYHERDHARVIDKKLVSGKVVEKLKEEGLLPTKYVPSHKLDPALDRKAAAGHDKKSWLKRGGEGAHNWGIGIKGMEDEVLKEARRENDNKEEDRRGRKEERGEEKKEGPGLVGKRMTVVLKKPGNRRRRGEEKKEE